MLRALGIAFVLGTVLTSSPGVQSQERKVQSKVFHEMPAEELQAIRESRTTAQKEIFKDRERYDSPEIAHVLGEPTFIIAIVKVTSVTAQDKAVSPYLRVDFEIKQILRGSSEKTNVYAESRWTPDSKFLGGPPTTVIDYREPKPGNLYMIGYSLHIYGDRGSKVYVGGGVDLSVPGQGQTLAEIQHFLNIDASADASNFGPFVVALNDQVPWIRDLAAQRLAGSDACDASPSCGEALLSRAGELLQSKTVRERYEGVEWLQGIARHFHKQPSSMANDSLRDLLVSATSDSNIVIGDQAFGSLASWDFWRTAEPGHCLEVIPPMRKSAVWNHEETKDISISSPLGTLTTCMPPSAAAN